MGWSMLAGASTLYDSAGRADAFSFIAFNQDTGEILSHAHRAVFALAQADLRAPYGAIEILKAGVAGENLWLNQTPLPLARLVVDMLGEPGNWELPPTAKQYAS